MRLIPLEYAENLHFAEDIYDIRSRILARKGAQISPKIISQLQSMGIHSVYVNDRYSQNELVPPISSDLKMSLLQELFKTYEVIRHRHEAGKTVEESDLPFLDGVLKAADHALYEVIHTPRQYLSFTDVKMRDLYTVSHSLNVAVLSLLLGIDAGLDPTKQKELFLGALFHDIGMNYINESVFMKNGKLDVQEFIKIKEHPAKGYELFKDFSFANAFMKVIVLQHHEKLDGSGYPGPAKEKEIHLLAQIVAVADGYDAMTSDRVYSRAVSPAQALEYTVQASGKTLNPKLVDLFIRKIMPYPEGSLVRLSTAECALVIKTNASDPLRPVVMTIDPVTRRLRSEPLNLSETLDVRIEGLQYPLP